MASTAERYEDALRRLEIYERIGDRAAEGKILEAAMRVINRNDLVREFVDELSKPTPTE